MVWASSTQAAPVMQDQLVARIRGEPVHLSIDASQALLLWTGISLMANCVARIPGRYAPIGGVEPGLGRRGQRSL